MNSRQNVALACLAVSAAILAALLIGMWSQPAQADVSMRGGRYVVATAKINAATGYVFVMDMSSGYLSVYGLTSRDPLQFLNVVPLRQAFEEAAAKSQTPAPR